MHTNSNISPPNAGNPNVARADDTFSVVQSACVANKVLTPPEYTTLNPICLSVKV